MADFRAFSALRYNPEVAGDPAKLIAPPYDVVSPEDERALYAASPYNIARVDYGPSSPDDSERQNRYTRALEQLTTWQAKGVLVRDAQPMLYVYDQEFTVQGRRLTRRAIFGRLRLAEWKEGVVLPHEQTRAAAKADRLELLRKTRVSLSPILAMYRSPTSKPLLDETDLGPPLLDATLPDERHTLRPVDAAAAQYVGHSLRGQKLYVADGHHRYETALAYRDECRERAKEWTGDEPENFVLAALVDLDDPGLLVLPTHRVVKLASSGNVLEGLGPAFTLEDAGDAGSVADLERLLHRMAQGGKTAHSFGAAGLALGRLHLIRATDRALAERAVPSEHAQAWRELDVNVLHYAVMPALTAIPDATAFTDDAFSAVREVSSGKWDAALLLNPTRLEEVVACAEAGERMPLKSTYFFPKLATGVVMYPFD